jgi:hypothetical protein
MKPSRLKLFYFLMFFGGVMLFGFSLKNYLSNGELSQKYERTIGRISSYGDNADGSKFPVVLFITLDSQKVYYKAIDKKVKKGYEIGDEVELFYDLINPTDVHFRAFSNSMLLLGLFAGAGFLLVGTFFSFGEIRKKMTEARLRAAGKKVTARVAGTGFINKPFSSGTLFVIDCTWQRHDGMTFSFRSEPLEADPSSIYPVGSSIEVLIDINNPANYLVLI